MTFDDLLQVLSARISRIRRPHPVKVAIDGIDAAGKTTLADALARVMRESGQEVIRASIDGFHRPRSERFARGAFSPLGYYEDSFDYECLRHALLATVVTRRARRLPSAGIRSHDMIGPSLAEAVRCSASAILLFDGVFLFRPEINRHWDYRVFLDVSFDEALRRAIARDGVRMGGDTAAADRYRKRYFPGQQIYLDRVQPKSLADVVVHYDDPSTPTIASGAIGLPPGVAGP